LDDLVVVQMVSISVVAKAVKLVDGMVASMAVGMVASMASEMAASMVDLLVQKWVVMMDSGSEHDEVVMMAASKDASWEFGWVDEMASCWVMKLVDNLVCEKADK